MFAQLLRESQTCRLPCWWNLTPGESDWKTAQELFTSLGLRVHAYGKEGASIRSYDVTGVTPKSGTQFLQKYGVQDGIIQDILVKAVPAKGYEDTQFARDWQPFLLPQILSAYGKPAEVLLLTYHSVPDTSVPYYLIVFYPEQGFLVMYTGNRIEVGNALRICPLQSELVLITWPPGKYSSLAEVIPQPNPFFHPAEEYMPIQKVTNLSVEAFYANFKNADDQVCFDTPASLW